MIVYANSCSYGVVTNGKTYSEIVADNLSATLINHGSPGCCNERIFRVSTRDILNLVQNTDPSEILVLIGLTNTFRGEVWSDTLALFDDGYFKSFTATNSSKFDSYIKQFHIAYNQEAAIINLLQQLVTFTCFLKSMGIKYRIWANTPHLQPIDWNLSFVKPFYEFVMADKNILSLFEFNFVQHAESLGYKTCDKPFNDGGHPDSAAHEIMANWLLNQL